MSMCVFMIVVLLLRPAIKVGVDGPCGRTKQNIPFGASSGAFTSQCMKWFGSWSCRARFFFNISEHADGERRGPVSIGRVPKGAFSPRPSRRYPPIRSSPSAFAVGMRRKSC